MTEHQKEKLELFREFGSNAAEAYNFIFGDAIAAEQTETAPQAQLLTSDIADGVYYIYEDGSKELFEGQTPKNDVSYIGVKQGDRRVAVTLNDIKGGDEDNEFPLFNEDARLPRTCDLYTTNRDINAAEDMNGEANTEFIKKCGTPIPLLNDTHIPSAGEVMLISMHLSKVNAALALAGGEKLEGWHWTSTLFNGYNAWNVFFSNGVLGSNFSKCISFVVRAVAAFI